MLKLRGYPHFFVPLPVQMWPDGSQSLYSSICCALLFELKRLILR